MVHVLVWIFERSDGEPRQKVQNTQRFQDLYRIDLVSKKCLLMPHRPHEELLVLEDQRHDPVQEVYRPQQ